MSAHAQRPRMARMIASAAVAGVACLSALSVGAAGSVPAARAAGASGSSAATARAATAYLLAAQNADGGLGPAAGSPSYSLFAGWAGLGLASAGVNLARVSHGGPSLLAYIERGGVSDTGSLERTILAVHAAGVSARAVNGRDLASLLRERIRRDGSIGGQVNLTAFGVLALRAAGVPVPAASLRWLAAQQDPDGGFGFSVGGGSSDPDDTGSVLEALAGANDPSAQRARTRAVGYLRGVQARDGGFSAGPGSEPNAQSTAWAVQGLIAAGVAPGAVHRPGGRSPLAFLIGLTAPGGQVSYARGTVQTPVWVTGEALMALEGRPLPIAPPPGAPGPAQPAGGSAGRAAGGARPGPSHEHIRPGGPATAGSTAGSVAGGHPAGPGGGRSGTGHRPAADRHRPALAPPSAGAVTRDDLAAVASAAGTMTAVALAPLGI